MKNLITSIILASAVATSAYAGSVQTPVFVEPVVAPPPAPTWAGFYVGGLIGMDTGTITETGPSTPLPPFALDTTKYGAFAGINFQNNSLVYGAEVAYSHGQIPSSQVARTGGNEWFMDAKGRVGFDANGALLYGFAGWTIGATTLGANVWDWSGMNYGGGVQAKVTQNIFAGVEFIMRDLSGSNGVQNADYPNQSIHLRVGYEF